MDMPTISFDELVAERYLPGEETDPMLLLADAEIILGQEVTSHKVSVLEGKEMLRQVVTEGNHAPVNVVLVEFHKGDELRQLKSLIEIVKCR